MSAEYHGILTDNLLNRYARDNRDEYGDWLGKASLSDITSVQFASLPFIDDDMAFAVFNSIMDAVS